MPISHLKNIGLAYEEEGDFGITIIRPGTSANINGK